MVARRGGGSGAVRGGRKMALTQGTKRKVCYYYDGEGLRSPAGAAGPRGSPLGARGEWGAEGAGLRGEGRMGGVGVRGH